jgi:hypothetical protein
LNLTPTASNAAVGSYAKSLEEEVGDNHVKAGRGDIQMVVEKTKINQSDISLQYQLSIINLYTQIMSPFTTIFINL